VGDQRGDEGGAGGREVSAPGNFGPVVQLGYVVPDIRRAMRHWTEVIGVGPFYLIEHTPFTQVYYKGTPAKIDQSAALAQWGDIQVELVEQHNDTTSVNTTFAGRARGGLQHTASAASSRCNGARSARSSSRSSTRTSTTA
jgi:hypothetical protein